MTRRGGLGKGLDALLPTREESAEESRGPFREVDVALIEPNPQQPRSNFDDETIEQLATSLRTLGLLQPLVVREAGDRYLLVAGERRLRAAKLAGIERVPVLLVETDEQGALERALVENLHRENLNPIEEAIAYRQLIEDAGLTQEALADRLGRNRVSINQSLRLLDLPEAVQRLLMDNRLTAAHGRALLALEGNPFQERMAVRVAQEGLSVRDTQEQVARYQNLTKSVTAPSERLQSERPALISDSQRRLTDHLQTKVRVEFGKRKGKVVVDFNSLEELDRIVEVVLGRTAGATREVAAPDQS